MSLMLELLSLTNSNLLHQMLLLGSVRSFAIVHCNKCKVISQSSRLRKS